MLTPFSLQTHKGVPGRGTLYICRWSMKCSVNQTVPPAAVSQLLRWFGLQKFARHSV